MTLTTHRSPPLSRSTPTPLPPQQKLLTELVLELLIDMYLAFALDVKPCKVLFECPYHLWLCDAKTRLIGLVSSKELALVLNHPCLTVHKVQLFYQLVGFVCPHHLWCPHHSSCIHPWAKQWFIGPHYLPKFWGKNPKATTKVTLMSHQQGEWGSFPIYKFPGPNKYFILH